MLQELFGAIIFDLDGTLIDTLDDLSAAVNEILNNYNLPQHPKDDYLNMVGDGIQMLIKRSLPEDLSQNEETVLKFVELFNQSYLKHWNNKTKPYPGINDLLVQLRIKPLKLGVLSNKPQEFADLCVTHFFSQNAFDRVVGARNNIPKKPDPSSALDIAECFSVPPKNTIYVGDTSIDMYTAVNAGMFPVGVEWGFRDKEEMIDAGAKVILQHPSELLLMI